MNAVLLNFETATSVALSGSAVGSAKATATSIKRQVWGNPNKRVCIRDIFGFILVLGFFLSSLNFDFIFQQLEKEKPRLFFALISFFVRVLAC